MHRGLRRQDIGRPAGRGGARGPARAAALALVAAAGLAVSPLPASAAPRTVDPSTVSPALNPDFAPWTCRQTGQGIVCQGDASFAYDQEPTGVVCPAGEVVISGTGDEHMTRWHTADGLATKTIVNLSYPADVFTLAGAPDGPSLTIRGHWNRHYEYLVPGDRDSRVLTEVGAIYLANQPGSGLVLHDTGWVRYEPGQEFEGVAATRGIHDTLTDPSAVDSLICDALG